MAKSTQIVFGFLSFEYFLLQSVLLWSSDETLFIELIFCNHLDAGLLQPSENKHLEPSTMKGIARAYTEYENKYSIFCCYLEETTGTIHHLTLP